MFAIGSCEANNNAKYLQISYHVGGTVKKIY